MFLRRPNERTGSRGCVAFCAHCAAGGFLLQTLRTGGCGVVDSIAFADHHRYTAEDMRQLTERLQGAGEETLLSPRRRMR